MIYYVLFKINADGWIESNLAHFWFVQLYNTLIVSSIFFSFLRLLLIPLAKSTNWLFKAAFPIMLMCCWSLNKPWILWRIDATEDLSFALVMISFTDSKSSVASLPWLMTWISIALNNNDPTFSWDITAWFDSWSERVQIVAGWNSRRDAMVDDDRHKVYVERWSNLLRTCFNR